MVVFLIIPPFLKEVPRSSEAEDFIPVSLRFSLSKQSGVNGATTNKKPRVTCDPGPCKPSSVYTGTTLNMVFPFYQFRITLVIGSSRIPSAPAFAALMITSFAVFLGTTVSIAKDEPSDSGDMVGA